MSDRACLSLFCPWLYCALGGSKGMLVRCCDTGHGLKKEKSCWWLMLSFYSKVNWRPEEEKRWLLWGYPSGLWYNLEELLGFLRASLCAICAEPFFFPLTLISSWFYGTAEANRAMSSVCCAWCWGLSQLSSGLSERRPEKTLTSFRVRHSEKHQITDFCVSLPWWGRRASADYPGRWL